MDFEQERQKAQDAFDKKMRDLRLEKRVFDLLPDAVGQHSTKTRVNGFSFCADAWVIFEAKLSDVGALMKLLPPIEIFDWKDSCVWYGPVWNRREEARATKTAIAPFVIDIGKMDRYPTRAHVDWWTKLADLTLRVKAELTDAQSHFTLHADWGVSKSGGETYKWVKSQYLKTHIRCNKRRTVGGVREQISDEWMMWNPGTTWEDAIK